MTGTSIKRMHSLATSFCKACMSGSNGQDQDHSAARSDLCAQMGPPEPVGGFLSVFGPPE
jgi:hypothetical protein